MIGLRVVVNKKPVRCIDISCGSRVRVGVVSGKKHVEHHVCGNNVIEITLGDTHKEHYQ